MKKLLIVLNCLFSLTTFAMVRGGVNGGGADRSLSTIQNAWFLKGHKTQVDLCIVKDINFLLENDEIVSTINKVYNKWQNYIDTNEIYKDDEVEDDRIDLEKLKIENSIAIRFANNCDDSDLALHLGSENEIIRTIKEKYNDPLAFAYPISYEEKLGWGKGIVWIKNLEYIWQAKPYFEMILTHEIGHTLGNSHHDYTIMTEDIASFIPEIQFPLRRFDIDDNTRSPDFYTNIDWEKKLISCSTCNLDNGYIWLRNSNHEKRVVGDIFGIKSKYENLKSSFEFISIPNLKSNDENIIHGKYVLMLDDKKYEYPVTAFVRNVSLRSGQGYTFGRSRIFDLINDEGNETYMSYYFGDIGIEISNIMGQIEINGQKKSILFEYKAWTNFISVPKYENQTDEGMFENADDYTVSLIENGEKYYLFAKMRKIGLSEEMKKGIK